MLNRREWLGISVTAGAALAFNPRLLWAAQQQLITRTIPSSGERVPIIGLGTSATFAQNANAADISALREVLKTLIDAGGTVVDTAPSYGAGASEQALGRIARELGIVEKTFWAAKVNAANMNGGGSASPAAVRQQLQTTMQRLGTPQIDLMQIHNLGDVPTHLGILKEMKQAKQIRYIGITTMQEQQYPELQQIMRNEPLDFIGIDYAIDNREVEQTILPLAKERGIAVAIYLPFGRNRLWNRIGNRPLPEWASEFDAKSWAQFMLKYVAAHPAVTVVTPGTSKAANMADNLGGGVGRLPDEAMRKRMAQFIDALPAPSGQAMQGQPGQPQGMPPQAPGIAVAATILDRYVGEYKAQSGFTMTFRRDGSSLVVKPGNNPEAPLAARSETRFQDPRGPFIDFQVDGQGKVTGLVLEQQGPQGPQRVSLERK